jgi:L-threonylcarbamoyladenylate synthase
MPTETVYGLAGAALDPIALARIFETKERPTFDPLIIHVGMSAKRVAELDRLGLGNSKKLSPAAIDIANLLMASFWPGPLTLVLPKNDQVPDLATSGLPTVAVRMPKHSTAQALIAAAGTPLAAPSANRFGRISPTSAADVFSELGDRIHWIIDGGRCEIGVESTILAISEDGKLALLRPGGLAVEDIERVSKMTVARTPVAKPAPAEQSTDASQPSPLQPVPLAPGMLESHYAPRKKLLLLPTSLSDLNSLPTGWKLEGRVGLLTIGNRAQIASAKWKTISGQEPLCISLSESGSLQEAARNLFHSLRELDQSDASVLVSEPCLDLTGLGYAIGDRLRRASSAK